MSVRAQKSQTHLMNHSDVITCMDIFIPEGIAATGHKGVGTCERICFVRFVQVAFYLVLSHFYSFCYYLYGFNPFYNNAPNFYHMSRIII